MNLGVLTVPLYDRSLEEALSYLSKLGVQTVELGGGGYPGNRHTIDYITGQQDVGHLKELTEKYNIDICAIAGHGNPLHPDRETAEKFRKDFSDSVLLAEKLGVKTVICFSGCPGDCPESKYPNWVTCMWPTDFSKILTWQWNDVLIPYWKETAAFARDHGVTKLAFEMHPGFMVYNPDTLMRLREAVGPEIGANFDPSHLIWQGVEPVSAIKYLGNAIYHVHAKDTRMDKENVARTGVLDTSGYGTDMNRKPWMFRSVGYGHDLFYWKEIVSALQMTGYDGALSIEHEDPLMTSTEGLEKAIATLKEAMVFEQVRQRHQF